ncbi:MAG: EAL domain-containing protein [Campylobacterales bacterium]|nr:EAL domain-containing protein [Campylobacterales bacterium]
MVSIQQLIEERRLVVHFQPILSVRGRTFFGLEALIRGIGEDGTTIPPAVLFEEAARAGLIIELDRLARHLAIESFYPLWLENKRLLLFVNFESSLIDTFRPGSYLFDGLLSRYGIPFSNIVLEIKEDEIRDTGKLEEFCAHYRALGFNIALDDFGVGSSGFDRLAIVRPDIIKIDRSLISDIDTDHIHQEIVHAICRMSTNIGAITLAEGVETLAEAGASKLSGATLIQGFWSARPTPHPVCDHFREKIDTIKSYCETLQNARHAHDEELRSKAEALCIEFQEKIVSLEELARWDRMLEPLLYDAGDIEALYLISTSARQIGPTLLRGKTRSFFEPAEHGSDHSRKEYYIRTLDSMNHYYLTGNYVSLATGNLCCTYARKIEIETEPFVLCIDFIR